MLSLTQRQVPSISYEGSSPYSYATGSGKQVKQNKIILRSFVRAQTVSEAS